MDWSLKFLVSLYLVLCLVIPGTGLAQSSSTAQSSPLPAFLQNINSVEEYNALSAEQKEEAQAFFNQSLGPTAATSTRLPETSVSCFDYYTFGSIQVDVEPITHTAVAGTPLTFVGTVTNNNPYPIVNGAAFVKIFNQQEDPLLTKQNGHPVVDQFFAVRNLTLAAGESAPIEFVWNVPAYATKGSYELVTYFMTHDRFNHLGLPFTDDVTGNKASFSVAGGVTGGVFFDKNNIYLNDQLFRFAAYPPRFTSDEPVTLSVPVVNTSDQPFAVAATFTLYNWDGLRIEQKLDESRETVTLAPGASTTLRYTATKAIGAVSFVRVQLNYQDTSSILNVRFAREGIDEIRLNFPSVLEYPLVAGKENTIFSCVHSTYTDVVEGGQLTLTLTDTAGTVLHTYTYDGTITGAMMAVKDTYSPLHTLTDFTLTTILKKGGVMVEEVVTKYSCEDINPDLCTTQENTTKAPLSPYHLMIAGGLSLIGLAVLLFVLRSSHVIKIVIVATLVLLGGFNGAHEAEAKSVSFTDTYNGDLYRYNGIDDPSIDSLSVGLSSPAYTVTHIANAYNASTSDVYNDGASIPVGSSIRFAPETPKNTDISWVGVGRLSDSPFGEWRAGATAPKQEGELEDGYKVNAFGVLTPSHREVATCEAKDFVNMVNEFTVYIPFVINPVIPSYTASTNLSCGSPAANGSVTCAVTASGPISFRFNYPSTYGHFYYRFYDPRDINTPIFKVEPGCYGTAEPLKTVESGCDSDACTQTAGLPQNFRATIPTQSITFDLTAITPTGAPPSAPLIRGNSTMSSAAPASGSAGSTINFYFRADDPENNTIRYEYTWSDVGVPSSVPATGFVPDLTVRSTSRNFASPGSYTLTVAAIDSNANRSLVSTHTITITGTSASFTVPTTCTVPDGQSTCIIAISWTSTGLANPRINNLTTGTIISTNPNGSSVPVTLSYRSSPTILTANDGTTQLASRSVNTVCASGSTWNGTACMAPPAPPANLSIGYCTVPGDGVSTNCIGSVSWNFVSSPAPYQVQHQNTLTFIQTDVNDPSETVPFTFTLGTHTFNAYSNSTITGTRSAVINCAPGSSRSGSVCITPPPVNIVLTSTPSIVRFGGTSEVEITITSPAPLNCSHTGITTTPQNFTHDPLLGQTSRRVVTSQAFNSAQRIVVSCTDGTTTHQSEGIITVTPRLQEI